MQNNSLHFGIMLRVRNVNSKGGGVRVVVIVVVDCGLTSHSAICQLYTCSDGTDVQFPNFDPLPGTHAMDS